MARLGFGGDGHEEPRARARGARERHLRAQARRRVQVDPGAAQAQAGAPREPEVRRVPVDTSGVRLFSHQSLREPRRHRRGGPPHRRREGVRRVRGGDGGGRDAGAEAAQARAHFFPSRQVETRLHKEHDDAHELALLESPGGAERARVHEGARRERVPGSRRRGRQPARRVDEPGGRRAVDSKIPSLRSGQGVRAVRHAARSFGAVRFSALRLQRVQHHVRRARRRHDHRLPADGEL